MSFPYWWPSSKHGFYRPQKGQAPSREPLGASNESEAPMQRLSSVSTLRAVSNYVSPRGSIQTAPASATAARTVSRAIQKQALPVAQKASGGVSLITGVTEKSPTTLTGKASGVTARYEKVAGTQDATKPATTVAAVDQAAPRVYGTGSPISATVQYDQPAITRALPAPIGQAVAQLHPSQPLRRTRRSQHYTSGNWPIGGIFRPPYGGFAVPWYIRREPTGLGDVESSYATGTSSAAATLTDTAVGYIYSQLKTLDVVGVITAADKAASVIGSTTLSSKIKSELYSAIYNEIAAAGSAATQAQLATIFSTALSAAASTLALTSVLTSSAIATLSKNTAAYIVALVPSTYAAGGAASTSTGGAVSSLPTVTRTSLTAAQIAALQKAQVAALPTVTASTAAKAAAASELAKAAAASSSSSKMLPVAIGAAAVGLLLLAKFMK